MNNIRIKCPICKQFITEEGIKAHLESNCQYNIVKMDGTVISLVKDGDNRNVNSNGDVLITSKFQKNNSNHIYLSPKSVERKKTVQSTLFGNFKRKSNVDNTLNNKISNHSLNQFKSTYSENNNINDNTINNNINTDNIPDNNINNNNFNNNNFNNNNINDNSISNNIISNNINNNNINNNNINNNNINNNNINNNNINNNNIDNNIINNNNIIDNNINNNINNNNNNNKNNIIISNNVNNKFKEIPIENDIFPHFDMYKKYDSQTKSNNSSVANKDKKRLSLAELVRPKTLKDYFGQEELIGEKSILKTLIMENRIPSLILWGPPGVGIY